MDEDSRERLSRGLYLRLRRSGWSHEEAMSRVTLRYWPPEIRESRG